jgi:hypothetical protein
MRVRALAIAALFVTAVVADTPSSAPAGWRPNCGDLVAPCAGVFKVALDRMDSYTGSNSMVVTSQSTAPAFGGVMQAVRADEFRGKRLRYTAGIKTEGVRNWTGLWLRVDRLDGKVLQFDNMETSSRSLHGDHAWDDRSVVLDVPQDAAAIWFGVVLSGGGKVWIDNVRLDSVGPNVAVTGRKPDRDILVPGLANLKLEAPRNLDFED